MRFGENNVFLVQNISIYMNFGGTGECTYSTVHFLFIIQKNGKSTREWPILKSNSASFWFKTFFPRINNKKLMKRGPPLLFLYTVSIVVLIDFIAILLTPGIFLTQIVNTNVHLIHFHSNSHIQMHFPKSRVSKVSNQYQSLNICLRRKM